ncbi:pkinase-domain-containing protein [Lichtheimia corymbifera JMRC:FSU:9682]|uniref:Pkinase-domain-containing protein n=1 Tax=Lichtheimia corymbifera JMRC:FSU:9682 TaxID=1263082 RepID=A0A068S327_9FUNG|nr:pkinase-domain-containing protein [Lichtheimia corymbifera JMRC:FSU:9682]
MSVFQQIKQFLRNSTNRSSTNSDDSEDTISQREAKKYEAVARLVEEEKLARQRLPSYAGLERYKLVDTLGDGAFSKVYKAVDLEKDENVAVKVVRKYELKPQQRASVLKEIQIMRTLKHQSIVQFKSFIETKEYYFLVLELCEGGELFHQIVRLTYFSEELSRHCIRQVADAIRYLHEEKGVVHRDIKPENLLFDPIPFHPRKSAPPPVPPGDEDKEDEGEFIEGVGGGGIGRVKIADFGLSKVVWDQHTMTPCGTVGYTAPEIVRDERYSKSVDMWALGCVLYTLLCGFPPFYDESIEVLTQKVAKGQYTFLSPWWDPISNEAKDLIGHLLCINPEERYTIDQFMKHPWMKKKPLGTIAESPSIHTAESTDQLTPQSTGHMSPQIATTPEALDIPGATTLETPAHERNRRDVFSGLPSMKEVFDVSYAVHRMAEERSRRKEIRRRQQQQQQASSHFTYPNMMGNIDDDDDDDDDDNDGDDQENIAPPPNVSSHGEPTSLLQKMQRDKITQQMDKPAVSTKRSSAHKKSKPTFELSLEKATLIDRRRRHQKEENNE